ncbi:radical SAM protein [Salinactinospora qingdaonensis]|uniref:Radical SAM core domain-containing protein n=1 Tax=Salinactinospora qingdaonensis TaxID=702744 RepID=A0ABP7FBP6_9ACTN
MHKKQQSQTNASSVAPLRFLWLEITGRCQLECSHCYASSGPSGTHGTMTRVDWQRVIAEASEAEVGMLQFIGGEPTLHPDLPDLVDYALTVGIEVEVFSNLVHVPTRLWEVFSRPGVQLATSYYSDDSGEHAAITKRVTRDRTKENIAEALRRSIPLRVGIIDLREGQRVEQARAELESLGVTSIGVDRLRQVGRGVRDQQPSLDQLCGHCASGNLAIATDGTVWPCVFTRWLPIGNIRDMSLTEIIDSPYASRVTGELRDFFGVHQAPCTPGMCTPKCGPKCSPDCAPSKCGPNPNCVPRYSCGPCHPKDRTCKPEQNCKPNQCRPR